MKDQNFRILRPKETAEFLGVSVTTLWRYSKEKDFPRKVTIGKRATGYRSDELKAFIERNQDTVTSGGQ